jgi:hypothetical protein
VDLDSPAARPITDRENSPGWSYNPSAWPERLPVAALGLTGLGIATYLGLYQLDLIRRVWEPFFGGWSALWVG